MPPSAKQHPEHKQGVSQRSSKHAPIEITSKRPVSRKRIVVEVKAIQPCDPRFLPLAGEFSAQKFQQDYTFLTEARLNELQTLRDSLKRARKLLANSPRHLYDEREQEVNKLELAIKRAESGVNKDKKDKVEQEVLAKAAEEEKGRRKQGKKAWWMKRSEKKQLLTRARYDALAHSKGKLAVKKAIEKKQKKISQKEKKNRPFRIRPDVISEPKHSFVEDGGGGPLRKRQRVN